MNKNRVAFMALFFLLAGYALCFGEVQQPLLKWQYGGCYSSWCETGWYASPAVADLDGDGHQEVIASAYSIVVLHGENGELQWRVSAGHDRSEPDAVNVGRTWPGVLVTDIDGDQEVEIITAHGGGYVSVYDKDGFFKTGWPQQPTNNELRGLNVADLDNDGTSELVVTGAVYGKTNTWVYEHTGTLRSGWPQMADSSGYAYGVFNDNSWIGDLNKDTQLEIIVPSDVHYICAYDAAGEQLASHDQYGNDGWGKVGIWEDPDIELRGWGDCSTTRAERYRANFAHGASVITDLDGDGAMEVVVSGNMYDCAEGHPPGKYTSLFIFNSDRSRFNKPGWDWQQPPIDIGAPLSEAYSEIENCQPNPVPVDLDGDGIKEILFSSYDGRIHSFWLDKTEHHTWPYAVYNPAEGFFRFSSEPVVADLDNDGKAEVLFVSWVEKNESDLTVPLRLGKLHVLNYKGEVLYELELPAPRVSSRRWNGALAAPTIANIDKDSDLELVINTVYAGFLAYDLPGSADARILWHTGRNKLFTDNASPGEKQAVMTPFLPLLLTE